MTETNHLETLKQAERANGRADLLSEQKAANDQAIEAQATAYLAALKEIDAEGK